MHKHTNEIDIAVSTGNIECYASVSDKIKIKTTRQQLGTW